MFFLVVLFLFLTYMEIKFDWKWRYPERAKRIKAVKAMVRSRSRSFLR